MSSVTDVQTDATGEGKESSRVEGVRVAFLAGFFFAFRIVIVLLFVRLFGADARSGAEAGLMLDALLLGLACFVALARAIAPSDR